ncbi:MAG: hypothetical protein KGO83_06805 [Paenibacillaceae bacterium]|nr:hypothetical protein [Paenibacillaceae bacterium]
MVAAQNRKKGCFTLKKMILKKTGEMKRALGIKFHQKKHGSFFIHMVYIFPMKSIWKKIPDQSMLFYCLDVRIPDFLLFLEEKLASYCTESTIAKKQRY